MSEQVVQEHYRRLANNYDQFLYYSPEFVRTLTEKMIHHLKLEPKDRLLDLGCGTAMYSLDILKQIPLEEPVLAVEPFKEMLDKIPEDPRLTPVLDDALNFSKRKDVAYNKILIKEAIHHVKEKEELFGNLLERLPQGGRLLLVHVPPKLDYPLFNKALERARHWHADPLKLAATLNQVGFDVEADVLDYPHTLPKRHYFKMVENQYMSVLSSFSQKEIQSGLEEMEQTYKDQDSLKFVDRFDYISARKP